MTQAASLLRQSNTVTGLFRDRDAAERAYRCAIELGYEKSQINVIMSEATRNRYFSDDPQTQTGLASKAAEDAEQRNEADKLGGPVGGTASTIAPAVAAVGTVLLFPGLVVAGPVVVALAAAGAVGVAGGLIGMLADWGIASGRIEEYEAGIRDGGILMGVTSNSKEDARSLERQWRASGGSLVHA